MAVQLAVGTPLADALNTAVHTKLLEVGWGTEDDTSLAEFIVLMLVNGKTEEQIAVELATDILPDGEGINEFAGWLFEQVRLLQGISSAQTTTSQAIPSIPDGPDSRDNQTIPAAYDSDMTGADGSGLGNVPTGPKNLRNGSSGGRGSRMMGQVSRAMDRSKDSPLHRIRQGSSDRINSHGRDTPRGPRSIQNRQPRPGLQKALNGMGTPGMNNMMNMKQAGQMPMPVSAQQQMEFMAMMEQQAQMFAQIMPALMSPGSNQNTNNGQHGKSLFDRVEQGPRRGRGGRSQNGASRHNSAATSGRDTAMEDAAGAEAAHPSNDASKTPADPSMTMCHFNLRCTNKACVYVHQSPAAPEGTVVDMSDTCSYGNACKNSRCAGKHPSPALIKAYQAEEMCRFYPNCTKAHCTFKHPTMPICRNGGDCNIPNCKFTHLTTKCKYTVCKNARCPYKHDEGQRGTFTDNVWTADSAKKDGKEHVSERKFVEEGADEELIKPEEPMAEAAEVIS